MSRIMTPERETEARRLAAAGSTLADAARTMGVSYDTLGTWSRRRRVVFADGRLTPRPRAMTPAWSAGLAKARALCPPGELNRARAAASAERKARRAEAVARLNAFAAQASR